MNENRQRAITYLLAAEKQIEKAVEYISKSDQCLLEYAIELGIASGKTGAVRIELEKA